MFKQRARLDRNGNFFVAPSILDALGLVQSAADASSDWMVRAVRSVAAAWPVFVLAKICLLAGAVNLPKLLVHGDRGALVMLALGFVIDGAIWSLSKRRVIAVLRPHRSMWVMCLLASMAALTLGMFHYWLPHEARGAIPPLVGEFALAVVAMGLFGQQRLFGLAYCMSGGLCALLLRSDVPVAPVLVLVVAVALATVNQARDDMARLVARQEERRRSRRAHLLLTDYEEAGRGWFWETDRAGAITYFSGSLARSMKLDAGDLLGRQLTDLVIMDDRRASATEGERTLSFHLSARSAFNEIPVRAAITGDERWWAISGRPIINDYGQFQGFRGSGSDLTEMKRSQAEVARLAQFDSLTGLANRPQMMRHLEQSLTDPRGLAGDCALFLLDLDRFKSVNDTMGHPAGDALLRQVSQRLLRVVGDRGVVGRLGGDEFKVVLPGAVDRAKLAVLADAIIATLSQPYIIDGAQVVIGASIGIAVCPADGASADALIRNADLALYAAKGDGRGVHRFYSAGMLAEAEDRRRLEDDLRAAMAEGGLHLVYQPLVSARQEKIVGFEALLRWNHATRGEVSPTLFIPIAEDAGLIGALGEWVMRTACLAAAKWPADTRVAVNVSPLQFANPVLPGIVMNALASSGLAPERLELEITESAFLNEGEATDQMFAQLKAIGVRLALDDFGTGYSSLGYLRKAPFDKIKIDQSFVRGAAMRGNRNAAIITSIVSLADALGMDTVAEGVETHDELALVRSLGVSQVQGFIYGRGAVAEEVEARFTEQGEIVRPSGFKASREQRRSMLRSVVILHQDQRYVGRIRNISAGGAMIEGLWNVPPETLFMIQLADGTGVEARARWSVDDRMGVQFSAPIDLGAVQAAAPVRLAG